MLFSSSTRVSPVLSSYMLHGCEKSTLSMYANEKFNSKGKMEFDGNLSFHFITSSLKYPPNERKKSRFGKTHFPCELIKFSNTRMPCKWYVTINANINCDCFWSQKKTTKKWNSHENTWNCLKWRQFYRNLIMSLMLNTQNYSTFIW